MKPIVLPMLPGVASAAAITRATLARETPPSASLPGSRVMRP
ncbi:hypothetical protein KOJCDNHJ_00586 [Xanthomonas citri pv. punicae]|nr:hypothetical protein FICKIIDM_01805 [Xanthomonas citri pv. punicae]UIS27198.1 hypothetical protein KOJCDNHJ_00586 [Xanthomonas citri pv. punicae]